jgi:drug/metabolite transporter (DMT)-like permease
MLVSQVFGFILCLVPAIVSGESLPGPTAAFWALLAGASGIAGITGFYAALARGTMGLVAPLTALIAATIPSVVGIVNGAAVGPVLLLGMLVALAAVVVISLPETIPAFGVGRPSRPSISGSRLLEIGLVVVAGLGFAGFFLGVAASRNAGGGVWWPILLVRAAGLLLIGTGIVALRGSGRLQRLPVRGTSLPLACLAGAGDLGGNVFYIAALAQTSLPTAVVLSSLYPVQTTLLARLVLGERLTAIRLGGVGLAILGVILISVGSVA